MELKLQAVVSYQVGSGNNAWASARAVIITLHPWAVLPVLEMTCFILRELRWLLLASSRVNCRRGNSGQKGTGRDPVLILYSLFPFLLPSAHWVPVFCLHTSLSESTVWRPSRVSKPSRCCSEGSTWRLRRKRGWWGSILERLCRGNDLSLTSSWKRRHSTSWDKKGILVGAGNWSDSSQDFEFGWRSHSLRLECFYLTSLSWMFASLSLVSVCTGLL